MKVSSYECAAWGGLKGLAESVGGLREELQLAGIPQWTGIQMKTQLSIRK